MESLTAAEYTEDWTPISTTELGWSTSCQVSARFFQCTRRSVHKQSHGYFHALLVPPSSQNFKANFDGVVFNNSHSASVGVIIRDRNGEVIEAKSKHIPLPNLVLEVEAMACKRAVKFAYEFSIQEVIFEGDSLTVIQAINNGGASEVPYDNIIDDIIVFASHLSKAKFRHVKRTCNRLVDALAKKAKNGDVF